MDFKVFTGDSDMLLDVYEKAIELAKSRGKKPGERFDKEFQEMLEYTENQHKIKVLGNTKNLQELEKNIDNFLKNKKDE